MLLENPRSRPQRTGGGAQPQVKRQQWFVLGFTGLAAAFALLILPDPSFGSSATNEETTEASASSREAAEDPLMAEFMELRRSLSQSRRQAMETAGPQTEAEQMQLRRAWREEHAEQYERMRELADQLAQRSTAERPERELPTLEQQMSRLPEDASPTMREFMEERYQLRAARHNLGLDDPALTDEQRVARRQQYREEQSERHERVRQLSDQLAAESRAAMPERELPTLEQVLARLPADASPTMREFMEERYKLRAARHDLGLDDPALTDQQRMARRQQYREEQSERHERIRQLSDQLATEGRTP